MQYSEQCVEMDCGFKCCDALGKCPSQITGCVYSYSEQSKKCFDACTRTFYFSQGGCDSRGCSSFDPSAIVFELLFWVVVYWAAAVALYMCCKGLGKYLSKMEEEIAEDRRQKELNNQSNTDIMCQTSLENEAVLLNRVSIPKVKHVHKNQNIKRLRTANEEVPEKAVSAQERISQEKQQEE